MISITIYKNLRIYTTFLYGLLVNHMSWFTGKLLYYLFELIYTISLWFISELQHVVLGLLVNYTS